MNPSKTILVPFTKRRKISLETPTLNGTRIEFLKEVKYLASDSRPKAYLELTLGESTQEIRSGPKHMQLLPEQNLGTETEVSLSTLSDCRNIHGHLCLPNLVDQGRTSYRIGQVAKSATHCLPKYYKSQKFQLYWA